MIDNSIPVGHRTLHQSREKNKVPAIIPISTQGTAPCNILTISWLNSAKGVKKSTQFDPNTKIATKNNNQKYRIGFDQFNIFILIKAIFLNDLFLNTVRLTLSTSINNAPKGQSQPQNTLPNSRVATSVSSGSHPHTGMLCCQRK